MTNGVLADAMEIARVPNRFLNRWRIDGTLTTLAPLHMGSGLVTNHPSLVTKSSDGSTSKSAEVSGVVVDSAQRAYIPGSALKGALRAHLVQCNFHPSILREVFGAEENGNVAGIGGKAEFWDATWSGFEHPEAEQKCAELPYWRADRCTVVTASVAIDRDYRTAADGKLFHHEFVPPHVVFNLTVTGRNLTCDEVACLLHALDELNGPELQLGASTTKGYGRVRWELKDLHCLEADDVRNWLRAGSVSYENLPTVTEEMRQNIEGCRQQFPVASAKQPAVIRLVLTLDGPFLARDPREGGEGEPDAVPIRDADGVAILPATSLAGSLRSQAERIIRTLGGEACNIGDKDSICPPIVDIKEKDNLCLACQMFGASGWKSPITFYPLRCDGGTEFKQEFVAIDRFTGGGANHKKFNVTAVFAPRLKGYLTVDRSRLEDWSQELLIRVLRDLEEGDISVGSGSAKGYGMISGGDIQSTDVELLDVASVSGKLVFAIAHNRCATKAGL